MANKSATFLPPGPGRPGGPKSGPGGIPPPDPPTGPYMGLFGYIYGVWDPKMGVPEGGPGGAPRGRSGRAPRGGPPGPPRPRGRKFPPRGGAPRAPPDPPPGGSRGALAAPQKASSESRTGGGARPGPRHRSWRGTQLPGGTPGPPESCLRHQGPGPGPGPGAPEGRNPSKKWSRSKVPPHPPWAIITTAGARTGGGAPVRQGGDRREPRPTRKGRESPRGSSEEPQARSVR